MTVEDKKQEIIGAYHCDDQRGEGCSGCCDECKRMIAEDLEELIQMVRADAIDEFVKECCEYEDLTFDGYAIQRIKSIADELKEQKNE